MLLLVALANVVTWLSISETGAGSSGRADRIWSWLHSGLVEHRAYPLFALLLGYGLAVLARRYRQRAEARGLGLGEAMVMLRRRGWLLVTFGAVHALVFRGDILGVYGVATMLLAPLVVHRSHRRLCWLAGTSLVFSASTLLLLGHLSAGGAAESAEPTSAADGGSALLGLLALAGTHLAIWLVDIGFTLVSSLVLPMLVLGVLLGHTEVLSAPERHRRLLWMFVIVGVLSTALSLCQDLWGRPEAVESFLLSTWLGGLVALGWFGALGLLAGSSALMARTGSTMIRRLGAGSLSGYLGQSIGFVVIFGAAMIAEVRFTDVEAVAVAVLVWMMTLGLAQHQRFGRWAERRLRTAMSRGHEQISAGTAEVGQKRSRPAS